MNTGMLITVDATGFDFGNIPAQVLTDQDRVRHYENVYDDLRACFHRQDLRFERHSAAGTSVTYLPTGARVSQHNGATLVENRIVCLVALLIARAQNESTKTGIRLCN